MAKKKIEPVVFTPLNSVSSIPDIIEQKVAQIPNYEDSGVKYQGKYKTQQSGNTYELRTQVTRWSVIGIQNTTPSGLFDFTFARARSDLKFFCTKLIVHFRNLSTFGVTNYIVLSDYKDGNYSYRYVFVPVEATGTLVLDFSDSPRMFEGTHFGINTFATLGLTEYVAFVMHGWEEQQ